MSYNINITYLDIINNPSLLKYIKDPSMELLYLSIKHNKDSIKYINKQYLVDDLLFLLVDNWCSMIYVLDQMSYNVQKYIMNTKPHYFSLINNPFYDICVMAIEIDYCNIRFINNPDYNLCKLAVHKNYNAIFYINGKNIQYDDLLMYAIEKNPAIVTRLKNISDDIYYFAFSIDIDKIIKGGNIPLKFYIYLIETYPGIITKLVKDYNSAYDDYIQYAIQLDPLLASCVRSHNNFRSKMLWKLICADYSKFSNNMARDSQ